MKAEGSEKIKAKEGKDELAPFFTQFLKFTPRSFIFMAIMSLGTIWMLYSYGAQLRYGLSVTGLNNPIYWGFYIPNFVFFIGISHAGTFITAALRLAGAEWRRPVTRLAEAVTVLGLNFGGLNIAFDVARIERVPNNLLMFGRFESPLLWDIAAVATYLILSSVSLYTSMFPDIAHMKNRVKNVWLKKLYRILSLDWRGTAHQWHKLETSLFILSILIIPTMMLVHTVIAFILSMSVHPLWHESVFGPFFVAGALHSGIGFILMMMYLLRRFYHMEDLLTPRHFDNMGKLSMVMCFVWLYFTAIEFMTTFYGHEPLHMAVLLRRLISPRHGPVFTYMVLGDFALPVLILMFKRKEPIWAFIAGLLINVAMWVERYLILIPTLETPHLPYDLVVYTPSFYEWGMAVGSIMTFLLVYYLFTKFFPIIPAWEVTHEEEKALHSKDPNAVAHPRDEPDTFVTVGKYAVFFTFLLVELGIFAILINGIRNGIIFALVATEIADTASLIFSLGAFTTFAPIHLGTTYAVGRLMWYLIRDTGD
jgi:molybdopterin-containing oxidoreductase family membrane subunit